MSDEEAATVDKYTPTTQQIRNALQSAAAAFDWKERGEAFDRWLAAHDREVAAQALEDAARDWEALVQREMPPIRGSIWLTKRAAALRSGTEGSDE